MKKYLILITMMVCANLLPAGNMEFTAEFPYPRIINMEKYCTISYLQSVNTGREGFPLLPYLDYQILLPPNTKAKSITINKIEYYDKRESIRLLPGSQPQPISNGYYDIEIPEENCIYSSSEKYPSNCFKNLKTHYKKGHPVVGVAFCPIEYYPSKDSVRFINTISYEIEYSHAPIDQKMYKHNKLIAEELQALIINPGALDLYHPGFPRHDIFDILVITKASFTDCFTEYLDYKKTTGLTSQIITVEDIYSQFDGIDDQEKIRNAIIDNYQRYDIQYVILGGDSSPVDPERNIIPHRGLYGEVGGYEDFDIPADMYYSCLDGNWNGDNDDYWGEFDEADFLEEVAIGRISGATQNEISSHLNKLLLYQSTPVIGDIEKCLLAGKQMSAGIYGGEFLEEIANGSGLWGSLTTGISDNFEITRLYEMYFGWQPEDLLNVFNSGTNLVSSVTHGNTASCFGTSINLIDMSNITNNGANQGFFNCYSQACYSGAFDNRTTILEEYLPNSFAEKLCTIETGAASFIANSRYGWFFGSNTSGSSQLFAREFYDTLFDDEVLEIGKANSMSKEKNLSHLDGDSYRWTCYNLNLLGDPSMQLWTCSPAEITAEFTDPIFPGDLEISYSSELTDLQYSVIMNNQLLGNGNTNNASNGVLPLQSAVPSAGILDVYFNKQNHFQYHTEIEVQQVDYALVISDIQLCDDSAWNPNNLMEYDENISISFSLTNSGVLSGNEVMIELTSSSEYISITTNQIVLDYPESGESIELEDALEFQIAGDCPNLVDIPLSFSIIENNNIINQMYYEFRIFGAVLQLSDFSVFDHNNGVIDPGETADMEFSIINNGHVISPQLCVQLFCSSSHVTISQDQIELGGLSQEETGFATFEIELDEMIEAGDMLEFQLFVFGGDYVLIEDIEYCAGVEVEDFETGDFSSFDWYAPWGVMWEISDDAYEGDFSMCSPPLGNMSSRAIAIDFESNQDGIISYWVKTETDSTGEGHFYFYINNGQAKHSFGNNNDWMKKEAFVHQGMNQFKWVYHSPVACDSRVWIDKITFPPRDYISDANDCEITPLEACSYPNPFNPSVTIQYSLDNFEKEVTLDIYNIRGQKVRNWTLRSQKAGRYKHQWDGKNNMGYPVSSGNYFYLIKTINNASAGKMTLLK